MRWRPEIRMKLSQSTSDAAARTAVSRAAPGGHMAQAQASRKLAGNGADGSESSATARA
jgi:hypothetical protein